MLRLTVPKAETQYHVSVNTQCNIGYNLHIMTNSFVRCILLSSSLTSYDQEEKKQEAVSREKKKKGCKVCYCSFPRTDCVQGRFSYRKCTLREQTYQLSCDVYDCISVCVTRSVFCTFASLSCKTLAALHMGIPQLVKRPTEKPGSILTRVRIPGAARDFFRRANFQCRLSYGVRTALVCSRRHQHLFTR